MVHISSFVCMLKAPRKRCRPSLFYWLLCTDWVSVGVPELVSLHMHFQSSLLVKMEVHWLLENDAGQLYLTGAALRRMRCCGRHHHAQSFIKSQKSTPSSAASQNCGACESGGVLVMICRERRPPFRRWQSFAINHSRLWWVCKANVNAWMNSGLPDLTATLLNIPGRSF